MAMDILDLPMAMDYNDAKATTIRDYLKRLLVTLWEEKESFSGKRPFGNSGWQYDLYVALIKGGAIAGKLDSEGRIGEIDRVEADKLIVAAIDNLR